MRHSLQALEQCVIGGSTAISPNLLPVVEALQQEIVPADWLHPDGRPSPHTLLSWLKGKACVILVIHHISLSVLFSHFRPSSVSLGDSFIQISSCARASVHITLGKNRWKIPLRTSSGLKWQSKHKSLKSLFLIAMSNQPFAAGNELHVRFIFQMMHTARWTEILH